MSDVTDDEIGGYYDANIQPLEFPGMDEDTAAFHRAKYIRDVRANPEAVRQLREHLDSETDR